MNILVTLNSGYVKPLCVMLYSLFAAHPHQYFDIYILNKSLSSADFEFIKSKLNGKNYTLHDIKIDDSMLKDAPVTDRYPHEIYYRIFAAKFLPDSVEKVLYLDPDLVVLKSLDKLYCTDLDDNFFAAASHVGKPLEKLNGIRLNSNINGPYINSGVMLINTKLLRTEQDYKAIFDYINKKHNLLFLPDQDIISAVYSDRIITIDPYIYNMTERMLFSLKSVQRNIDFEWVKDNSAIIHYCGRNKPWKSNYKGVLDSFYKSCSESIGLE